jgi:hypothetical protein
MPHKFHAERRLDKVVEMLFAQTRRNRLTLLGLCHVDHSNNRIPGDSARLATIQHWRGSPMDSVVAKTRNRLSRKVANRPQQFAVGQHTVLGAAPPFPEVSFTYDEASR